jgi:hypothetical protein
MCNEKRSKRGLCSKHYERYRRARLEIPRELREKYDAELVKNGMLVEPYEDRDTPKEEFAKFAAELLLAESTENYKNAGKTKKQLDEETERFNAADRAIAAAHARHKPKASDKKAKEKPA